MPTNCEAMKHCGVFDPNVDPVIPGGLTQEDKQSLQAMGFEELRMVADDPDAVVGFANPRLPGGIEMRKVTVPAGTPFLLNRDTGAVVLAECGNIPGVIRIA